MQVGDEGPANFIVSTVVEAEHLLGYVKECQDKGRESSVCFDFILSYPTIFPFWCSFA